jgi:predicted RNase H-like nuclease (RuvC/YqgF family)
MTHHNPITQVIKKLKRHPHNSDQPDLTESETIANQRQLIKFWVDHATRLEEQNNQLKIELEEASQLVIQLRELANEDWSQEWLINFPLERPNHDTV